MSSERKEGNKADKWLQALLPNGEHAENLMVGRELDDSGVEDNELDKFYSALKQNDKIRKYNLSQISGGQSELNQFRKKLGQWHSAMLYADLLSYTPMNPDSEVHLEQRMQALLREALVWFPEAIFAQVLLHRRGDHKNEMKECTAIAVEQEGSVDGLRLADSFRKKTAEYARENGTTVSFDVHLRYSNRWKFSSDGHPIKLAPSETESVPRDVWIYPLKITTLYARRIQNGDTEKVLKDQEKEDLFFRKVALPALKEAKRYVKDANFGLLHMAQGVDVRFDPDDSTTICHLYIMSFTKEYQLYLNTSFGRTLMSLLSKLAHFFSIQRMLIQQKELEKQAHMLELVNEPLEKLGKTLLASQQDIQRVFSIMHEPSHCIFAAQPTIAKLFNDNKSVKITDNLAITIQHSPSRYSSDERKWIFASALTRFRGVNITDSDPADAVNTEIVFLREASFNKNHENYELSKAVVRLFEIDLLMCADKQPILRHLTKLKDIMVTPFKPGKYARYGVELRMIRSLLPDNFVDFKIYVNEEEIEKVTERVVSILPNANPLATQGHLLSFISDVIVQHSNKLNDEQRTTISATQICEKVPVARGGAFDWNNTSKATLGFESSKLWLPSDKNDWDDFRAILHHEYERAKRKWSVTGEYGDFQSPFVRLIHRCRKNAMPKPFKWDVNKSGLEIIWDKLTLSFSEGDFSIISIK